MMKRYLPVGTADRQSRWMDTMVAGNQLIYVEHKTGQNDGGQAWIGRAALSKSGRTVYFNSHALKRSGGQGFAGNHYCLETGDECWVSGIKSDGADRHWAGHGRVMIDAKVVDEYLAFRGLEQLDPRAFQVVTDIEDTYGSEFHDIENKTL